MGQGLYYKQNPYFCSKSVKNSHVTNIKGRFPPDIIMSEKWATFQEIDACSKISNRRSHDMDVKEVLNATSFQYTKTTRELLWIIDCLDWNPGQSMSLLLWMPTGAQGTLFDNQTGLHLEWDNAARWNSLEEVIGELMPLHFPGNSLGAAVDSFETHIEPWF
jgi:hypothetical protein